MREWVRKDLYFRAIWSQAYGFWKVWSKVGPSITEPYMYDCTVTPSEVVEATCDQINECVKTSSEVRDS